MDEEREQERRSLKSAEVPSVRTQGVRTGACVVRHGLLKAGVKCRGRERGRRAPAAPSPVALSAFPDVFLHSRGPDRRRMCAGVEASRVEESPRLLRSQGSSYPFIL